MQIQKLKKPYIKKYGVYSGFTVWIVDGKYIRDKIEKEFTNFAQHHLFSFIPENEFWIDKKHNGSEGEIRFYIEHLLVENRLMAHGMSYNKALSRANKVEAAERRKNILLPTREDLLKRIHRKLLRKYGTDIKIWKVHGQVVRDFYFIDFTEGGHELVYHFVPNNEVWIDDDLGRGELKFVLLHEIHERNLMYESLSDGKGGVKKVSEKERHKIYVRAHTASSELEYFYRHNPKGIDDKLKEEIKNSKVTIPEDSCNEQR